MTFELNKTLKEIYKLTEEFYNGHKIDAEFLDLDCPQSINLTIYTTIEDLSEIDRNIVNKLQDLVEKYDFEFNIYLEEYYDFEKEIDLYGEEVFGARTLDELYELDESELTDYEKTLLNTPKTSIFISNEIY